MESCLECIKNLENICVGDTVELKYVLWKNLSRYICIDGSKNIRVFAHIFSDKENVSFSPLVLSQNYIGNVNNQPGCHFDFYEIFKQNKGNYKGMKYYDRGIKTI